VFDDVRQRRAGIGTVCGAPLVTMIAAGVVDT
jgi:hypothetical protein